MNTFSSWIPAFTVTFIIASLLSSVVYWLAWLPSTAMLWVRRVFSAVACLVMLVTFAGLLGTIQPLFALGGLLITLVATGVQAHMEASIDGGSLKKKHHFVRSFLTFLCSATLVVLILLVITSLVVNPSRPNAWLGRAVMPGLWGILAGLVLAPLSISFCRWMFQSRHLRPGMDRTLRDEELAR